MGDSQYWLLVNIKNHMRSKKIAQSKADLLIQKLSKEEISDWFAWTPLFRDWLPLKNLVIEKNGVCELMVQLKESFAESETSVGDATMSGGQVDEATVNLYTNNSINEPKKHLEIEELLYKIPIDQADFVGDELTMSDIPKPPSLKSLFEDGYSEGNVLRISNRKGGRVRQESSMDSDRRGAARYDVKIEVLILGKGLSFRSETLNLSQTGAVLTKALPEALAEVPLDVLFIFKKGEINEKFAVKGKVLSTRENLRYLTFSNITAEGKKSFDRLIKIYFQEISR